MKNKLTRLTRKIFDAYERVWTRNHNHSCGLYNEGVDCMHWEAHFPSKDYSEFTKDQRAYFLTDANFYLLGIYEQ